MKELSFNEAYFRFDTKNNQHYLDFIGKNDLKVYLFLDAENIYNTESFLLNGQFIEIKYFSYELVNKKIKVKYS